MKAAKAMSKIIEACAWMVRHTYDHDPALENDDAIKALAVAAKDEYDRLQAEIERLSAAYATECDESVRVHARLNDANQRADDMEAQLRSVLEQAQKENGKLEELEAEVELAEKFHRVVVTERELERHKNARLREALRKYGRHELKSCWDPKVTRVSVTGCDCGLDAILKEEP